MCEYYLSFHDLSLVDGFTEAMRNNDVATFEKILFENGVDTTKPYEIDACNHRTLIGKTWYGPRVDGYERLDVKWIKSGAASMSAKIEAVEDSSMRHELRAMNYTGTLTPVRS